MGKKLSFSLFLMALISLQCIGQIETKLYTLENPFSLEYLQKNIKKTLPRLVYTETILEKLKNKVKTDSVIKNMYAAIKLNAEHIYKEPLLKRKLKGIRLLSVSRELLYRVNLLGVVYLVEKDEKALERLNEELIAVCNFSDWNPKHFLDVAEMALGVAIALDWTQGNLPKSTIDLSKKALVEKALVESWPKSGKAWHISKRTNNWNLVCQSGLIAASIAVTDKNPELASKTISRAMNTFPLALKTYAPDGAYPEGPTYWKYATSFSVTTIAMLESAFGTDFGYSNSPGFKESALFTSLSLTHSNLNYNYFDSRLERSINGDETLAWFAQKSGISNYFERERFLLPPEKMEKLFRLTGIAMSWMSLYEPTKKIELPESWKSDGENPIVIFKSKASDKNKYYLGSKGGRATLSHGNMDAGSFIFELSGVRWSLDLGMQSYFNLEKKGFRLWDSKQNGDRWTLLTKNNFGHSTLTVNNELFINDAYAPLIGYIEGENPKATFDLTAVYGDNIRKAVRSFTKDSATSLIIEDTFEISTKTKIITWQMMTTADVKITSDGAILSQDGKQLMLQNLSHPEIQVNIILLDPPPLNMDKKMTGLKRIEIKIPAEKLIKNGVLKIRLSGI